MIDEEIERVKFEVSMFGGERPAYRTNAPERYIDRDMAMAFGGWLEAKRATTPATPEDRRDGERWRRLCEYVDVGEGRVLINHNYVDSRKNFVAEMSDSSDLIVNMDNAIAADKTRIAAIDAAREG